MGGGGKGSAPAPVKPQYVDPVNGMTFSDPDTFMGMSTNPNGKSGAQQLNEEIAQRKAQELSDSNAAQKVKDDKAAADNLAFQTRHKAAKDAATSNINSYFTDQGVDPSKFATQIAGRINTADNNVVDGDPNPQGKFAPSMASDLYNEITSGKQSQNLAGYNKVFDPSYSLTALPDSVADPFVSTAVNNQFDPLNTQLTNAHKRGTLNDNGYSAALKTMADLRTGATSSVSKLGSGVINNDRSGIDSYIGTGRTAAGSAPLNTEFSVDPYVTNVTHMVDTDKANFGGDLQNAIGNTKYADLTTLLNAGGNAQGANDPTASNPNGAVGPGGVAIGGGDLSPSYIAAQTLANTKRGLNTEGNF